MPYRHQLQHVTFIFLLLFMSGCSLKFTSNHETIDTPNSPGDTGHFTIPTASPPRKDFLILTATITPSKTPKPTSTIKPTIPFEEARATSVELVKTNGGCKFPCWMGITPGKSSWEETQAYLSDFAVLSGKEVSLKLSKNTNTTTIVGNIFIRDGIVDRIVAYQSYSIYPVKRILVDYGQPEDIRLSVEGNYGALGKIGYFKLILFYSSQGIMVEIPGKTNKDKIVNVCLDENHVQRYSDSKSITNWLLWDPKANITFEEAGEDLGIIGGHGEGFRIVAEDFYPLAELSDLDINSFYKRFGGNENLDPCFVAQDPKWNNQP
jgi:hypothetical protein